MYSFYVLVLRLLTAIWLFFVTVLPLAENGEIAAIRKQGLQPPDGFTVTAHAGAMDTDNNSLESIKMITASDADIIEIDLNFRPDGTAVLYHDSNPSESQGTLLTEALQVIAKNPCIQINVDVRSAANLPLVQDLLVEYGLHERAFFTGTEAGRCAQVQRECPRIPYFLNTAVTETTDFHALAEQALQLGAVGININYAQASAELCSVMHEHGLLVSVWTVDERLDLYRMLSCGVDNITTNKPLTLIKIMQAYL